MSKKSPYARIYSSLLRDPDIIALLAKSDRGAKAFGHFVLTLLRLKDVNADNGTLTLELTAHAKLLGATAKSFRQSLDLIASACEQNGNEPFMYETECGRVCVRNYGEYQSTKHGGTREKPPPDDQLDPHLNTKSGAWYSGYSGIPEGECEGEPPPLPPEVDPASLPASYAGQMKEHPFNRAWEAWPRKFCESNARLAWNKALEATRKFGKDGEWLADRVVAYAGSYDSKRNTDEKGIGTEFHPHLATWLNNKRYDEDDEQWNAKSATGNRNTGAIAERNDRTFGSEQPPPKIRRLS